MNVNPVAESSLKNLKVGRYRHYKGGEYEVVSIAKHSESLELMVVYRCLYDGASWWVRPLDMFTEQVEIDGIMHPRFAYIGDKDNLLEGGLD